MKFTIYQESRPGRRPSNEDRIAYSYSRDSLLMVVADGMGGHLHGEVAAQIAAKSPLAIRGIKEMLNYSRDHSVADGLNHVATWNAAMLLSEDLMAATTAQQQRSSARFRD